MIARLTSRMGRGFQRLPDDLRPDQPPAVPLESADVILPVTKGKALRVSRMTVFVIALLTVCLVQLAGLIGILFAPSLETRVVVITSWMTATGLLINQLVNLVRGEANSAHLRKIDHDMKSPLQAIMLSTEMVEKNVEKIEKQTNGQLDERIRMGVREALRDPAMVSEFASLIAKEMFKNGGQPPQVQT
jgi:signal transduction histidine kinase